MELTSKQRAYLKSLAQTEETLFSVGKASITPELTAAVDEALTARELIKIGVLKNCADDPKELLSILCERTGATPVQVIGKKMVLYRPAKEDPKIQLPRGRKE